ncbi:MAG: DUF5131 family protein [Candidatus Hydrogenedentes bacterium]|nr:DUF5131 family protein [Candidatus Hydrogenedentota bacterium]
MGSNSSIEWTESTWNPVTGCTKISPGCKNCLDPTTPVLMVDMRWKPIGEITPGDEVVGFTESPRLGQNRVYERATVVDAWSTIAESVEIAVGGRKIVASVDHRFLARVRPYWREAERLSLQTSLVDIGMPSSLCKSKTEPYLSGYLAGVVGGDGTFRIDGSGRRGTKQSYLRVAVLSSDQPILNRLNEALAVVGCDGIEIQPFDGGSSELYPRENRAPMLKIETRRMANLVKVRDYCMPERDDVNWKAGFLAGFFDTDGSYTGKNLRFHQTKENGLLDVTKRFIGDLGFQSQREDFRRSTGRSERVIGAIEEKLRFLSAIQPAMTRKMTDFYGRRFPGKHGSRIDGVQRVGNRQLVDIQTTSGTFIAAGIATHNCYAERMAKRLKAMGQPNYRDGFEVTLHPHMLDLPLRWRKPQRIFVNSMSDLFHEKVPRDYIVQVFDVMRRAEWHQFQVLTKRSERLRELAPELDWPSNVWMGVSVENAKYVSRIDDLRNTGAQTKFLSLEPLLGPLQGLNLTGIHWVIVGGESGPGARPMDARWVVEIQRQCEQAKVAFFFKQWGGVNKKRAGRELNGRTYDEMPQRRAG